MSRKITTEIYIKECVEKHKDLYDHSRVVYKTGKHKVEIICKKHNSSFWQEANSHKSGAGCPLCANEMHGNTQRLTQEQFIQKSIEADGTDYNHSLVVYKNSTTKVDIVCNKEGHGVFSMLPLNRVRGQHCPKCARITATEKARKTQSKFIEDCQRHPDIDKFDLSDTVYEGDKNKVTIRCLEHGYFEVIASNFLHQSSGCPHCNELMFGFRHNLPGYLYLLGTSGGSIVKAGITNRTPAIRAKEISRSSGKDFKVLGHFFCENGMDARNAELEAHAWMTAKGSPVKDVFDGSTECFTNINAGSLICHLLGIQHTETA